MVTDSSYHDYLFMALDLMTSRLVVVSPELKILAATGSALEDSPPDLIGSLCHSTFFQNDEPCQDCPVLEVLETGRPTIRRIDRSGISGGPVVWRHFMPMYKDGRIEAVGILDLEAGSFSGQGHEHSSADTFLKNLLMSSADAIIASDMTGKILIFNEDASKITGYSQKEALEVLNIRNIYPGDGAREVMRRLRSEDYGGKGKLKSCRVDLLSKDGTTVPIELSASVVYEDGEELATVGFFHDLREKLRMEGELQSAQVQLMQAEKMGSLGKMAAGVAHQLNNPLGGIVRYAQLIKEEYEIDPEARQDLERIIEDAERCQHIVTELLDFARQTTLEIRPHDINQAISRTIFLLENQPVFKEIEIIQELDPNIPSVPSDIQQLYHVFMNLILNAADAMEGRGRLRVQTRPAVGSDGVCIEISDTGPGIPGHVLPHIFDPFFTTKDEGHGTGLGLSVAYGIIENHKGRLTACSAPGEGTTFVIELPLEPNKTEGGPNYGRG